MAPLPTSFLCFSRAITYVIAREKAKEDVGRWRDHGRDNRRE
jgi:hypothetical protein